MKKLLTFILLLATLAGYAQKNVPENVRELDDALLNKDTVVLKQVLHEELSYGHSNGWVETKEELLENLLSGHLVYTSINSTLLTMDHAEKVTIVRMESKINFVREGKAGEVKLHVMQVWVMNKHGWQLLSRQSTKID